VFPKIGVPQNGWFVMENIWKTLLKWMIWGYHHLRKHPDVWKTILRITGILPAKKRGLDGLDVFFSQGVVFDLQSPPGT